MKKTFITLALLAITAVANTPSSIEGVFRLPNGTDIKIYKLDNGVYNAKIVKLNGYRKLDTKNHDKKHKKDLLLGKVIMTNLKYNPQKNIWDNGIMYSTDVGVSVNLKILSANKDGLDVVGSKLIIRNRMFFKRIE